ncbi:MAG: Na+/H+ antiporter subunit [Gaiellaceae bacterium]|nr:Na+/H+ antiporter subunit [Gaiellaceae bacterium]
MTAHGVVVHVLVWLAVAAELVCVLGVALGRDAFARLHYASAAATLGPILLIVALLVEEGAHSTATAASVGVALLLLIATPITTIAVARAARVQR